MVRDLVGTVDGAKAAMGVLVTLDEPTKGMVEAARHSGIYTLHANGQGFPKVQIMTVEQLLAGQRPKTPPTLMPYTQAQTAPGERQPDQSPLASRVPPGTVALLRPEAGHI